MSCEQYEVLLLDYLDGRLDEAATADLEAHLEGCTQCQAEWAATREALEQVDSALAQAPELNVEASLEALRERIDGQEVAAHEPRPTWWATLRWWFAGGLSAAAAASIFAVVVSGTGPGPTPEPTDGPKPDLAKVEPAASEAAAMAGLLQELPLYETLECFEHYEQVATLVESDLDELERILEEVQG